MPKDITMNMSTKEVAIQITKVVLAVAIVGLLAAIVYQQQLLLQLLNGSVMVVK